MIGIYGGTFDPVHYGHLILAESCREQCRLDAVWFVPAAIPPHKQNHTLSAPADRIEMLKLASTYRTLSPERLREANELAGQNAIWSRRNTEF